MAERTRGPAFCWLVPGFAVSGGPGVAGGLVPDRAVPAVCLLLGLAAGAAWYALYPRPLARRLTFLVMVYLTTTGYAVVANLVGAGAWSFAPGEEDGGEEVLVAFGVVCALVLAERWHHARTDFRDETRRLRERDGATPEESVS
ncbi:hypothetical protein GCM10011519_28330 [Marmoricola endophyticus]|uniref:Uncharacterized protein n=1 Tax=Marmoricola endophyticus TaxID=2040280 RepID=A0A917BN88_9ACTN|nr:hypothetical protein [Marmoricola endophyticus]GGF52695.1 hypothetical protein GCM10011519_28330 [Marmoricola endophyticus]